jgi:peptide/nickel transport system substrate-binding protein
MENPIMHSTPLRRVVRIRALGVVAAVAAATVALAGCSGSATDTKSSAAAGSPTETLTVAVPSAPVSLDPALQNVDPANNQFIGIPYDTLIRLNADGGYDPDIATSWKYNDDSTQFTLTLRKGVKFSDGTAVTADAVVKSIEYMIAKGVNGGTWLGKDTTVAASGDDKVVVKLTKPNSTLPYLLSQRTHLGSVINPKGLEDPTALKSETYGAGQYVLDSGKTVANDTYVFTPNKYYWDKSKIKWAQIDIKVAGSAAAALQAVQNGDADMQLRADVPSAQAAEASGLDVVYAQAGLYGVGYLDRSGEISKPLANAKVRQALSLAIDRKSITTAVWGKFGKAGNDLTIDGFPGFSDSVSNSYAYNVKKAKKMLADAGYPDGFSFDMQTTNTGGADVPAQAIVQNWKDIGVTANLTVYSDTTQLINDTLNKKYAVGVYYYGAQQQYLQAKSFFNGGANQYNPFNSQDDKILSLLDQAAAEPDADKQNKLYEDVMQRAMVDEAWFSNVAYTPTTTIAKKGLTGLKFGALLAAPDIAWQVGPASSK